MTHRCRFCKQTTQADLCRICEEKLELIRKVKQLAKEVIKAYEGKNKRSNNLSEGDGTDHKAAGID